MFQSVLDFWFQEIEPAQRWKKDDVFDRQIEQRFGEMLRQAGQCELYTWRATAGGRLAEIIVLDQFSRNVYRDTPAAFAQDPLALALAQEGVRAGVHEELSEAERTFFLMPYMHSESAAVHIEAEKLFKTFTPAGNYEFELKHKVIIDRFGRYPHRNAILGRQSTEDELVFLQQPGSSF